MSMRIGIVGSGNLGRALGGRLARAGHELMFAGGVSSAEAASTFEGALNGTNGEAVRFAEVVVLAVPWASIGPALGEAGSFDDKVLWSCVNALKPDLSSGGWLRYLGGRRGRTYRAERSRRQRDSAFRRSDR